jgi:hypothetical protein
MNDGKNKLKGMKISSENIFIDCYRDNASQSWEYRVENIRKLAHKMACIDGGVPSINLP